MLPYTNHARRSRSASLSSWVRNRNHHEWILRRPSEIWAVDLSRRTNKRCFLSSSTLPLCQNESRTMPSLLPRKPVQQLHELAAVAWLLHYMLFPLVRELCTETKFIKGVSDRNLPLGYGTIGARYKEVWYLWYYMCMWVCGYVEEDLL